MTEQKNLKDVRINNRANVLQMICEHPGLTRQDISNRLGLSKMSVVNIITEYAEKGYVQEQVETPLHFNYKTAGRPSLRVSIVDNSVIVLGIFVSEMELTCSLINLRCEMLVSRSITPSTHENNAQLLKKLDQVIDQVICDGQAYMDHLQGIGIAAVGLIDARGGRIIAAENYPNVHDLPIVDYYNQRFQLPVVIANDMDASAIAERHFGHAIDAKNFIYIGVNSCIGLGIYINNEIFTGSNGFAGEIGFTTIDYTGKPSPFGYPGRLESFVAINKYVKKVNRDLKREVPGMPAFSERPVKWMDIALKAREGDPYCLEIVHAIGNYLAIATANVINLFDPEKIIIGGLIALAGQQMIDHIAQQIEGKTVCSHFHEHLSREQQQSISLSAFVDRSAVAGAGAIVFDAIFQGKLCLL